MLGLTLALLLGAGPEFRVLTSDGAELTGTISSLSAEKIELLTVDGAKELSTERLAEVARLEPAPAALIPPDDAKLVWIDLIDGSSLPSREYATEKGLVRFNSPSGTSFEVAARDVASVRFEEQTPDLALQWNAILEQDFAEDVVVTRKKEVLDYLTGKLGNVGAESLSFETEGETITIKLSRVEGLIYYHKAGRDLPAAAFLARLVGGAKIPVRSIELVDGLARLESPAGLSLSCRLEEISGFEFKVQYLSDIKPEKQVAVEPLGGEPQPLGPGIDRTCQGEPLKLDGEFHAKGLCLKPRTEQTYRIPQGKFGSFRALVGIDDRFRPEGHAKLTIYGDDRELYSGVFTGAEPAKPVDLNIAGARRLKLIVESPDGRYRPKCFLDLCDARISK